jgi:hypothetical protein
LLGIVLVWATAWLWPRGDDPAPPARPLAVAKAEAQALSRYSFVVVMTDDQRWDTLWAMPIVQEKLVKRGVKFVNAFVSSPECCPSRASFLAGGGPSGSSCSAP